MRTFEHFPEGYICKLCGKSVDKPCTLIPIDATGDDRICEAIPVHVDCVTKGDLRYSRAGNIFYKIGVMEEA